jgi:transcriptional regulator with XRE-family HTH domain
MEHYANPYFISDVDIARRIGKNLRTIRLDSDITRDELQTITGVHKKTIGDMESGKNVTMGTFIAILRGLNLLDKLNELLREEPISPVMLAKLQWRVPQRATGKR